MPEIEAETPKPKAAPKAKPVADAADWSLPARDENGFELASDGLPLSPQARAMAMAKAGIAADPLEIVTPEHIAGHAS